MEFGSHGQQGTKFLRLRRRSSRADLATWVPATVCLPAEQSAWRANRSSFIKEGAHRRAFGAMVGNLRVNQERRLVDQTGIDAANGREASDAPLNTVWARLPNERSEVRLVDQTGIEPVTS